jgi:hypothetical protein
MLKIEGIELFANPLQDHSSLKSFIISRALILSIAPFLLLRLLRADNSLLFERRLEAFELGAGHCD